MMVVFAGSSTFYWQLLSARPGHLSWFAIPLGLSITLIIGQVWGLISALARLSMISKSASEWNDGEFIGISGPLRPLRDPVLCPATGHQAVVVEYTLERKISQRISNSDATTYRKDVSGFLVAACAINQKSGPIKLLGFSRPEHFESAIVSDSKSIERFATFLTQAPLTPLTLDPLAAFRAFTSVMQDDDGEISRHFCNSDSPLSIIQKSLQLADAQELQESESSEPNTPHPEASSFNCRADTHNVDSHPDMPKMIEGLINELTIGKYRIQERWIPLGSTVTVYGIYRKSKRAIDLGTELTALQRGEIKPGKLHTNIYKGIAVCIFLLSFWFMSSVAGHYLLVREVREWIDARLPAHTAQGIHGVIKSVIPEDSELHREF